MRISPLKDGIYYFYTIVDNVKWYFAIPQALNHECDLFLTTDPDPHNWNKGGPGSYVTSSNHSYTYSNHKLLLNYSSGGIRVISNNPNCIKKSKCPSSLACVTRSQNTVPANIILYSNGIIFNKDCREYIGVELVGNTPVIKTYSDMSLTQNNILRIVPFSKPKTIPNGIYTISYGGKYLDYAIDLVIKGINPIFTSNKIPWYYGFNKLYTVDKITNSTLYIGISSSQLDNQNILYLTTDAKLAANTSIYTNGNISFNSDTFYMTTSLFFDNKNTKFTCATAGSNINIYIVEKYVNLWDNYSHSTNDFYGKICVNNKCLDSSGNFSATGIDWKYDSSKNNLYYTNPFGLENNSAFPNLDGPVKYCLVKNEKGFYVDNCENKTYNNLIFDGKSICDGTDKMCYSSDGTKINNDPTVFYNPQLNNFNCFQKQGTEHVTVPSCSNSEMTTECANKYCNKVDLDGVPMLVKNTNCGNWCSKNSFECKKMKEQFCSHFPTNYLCGCINSGKTPEYLLIKPSIQRVVDYAHKNNIPIPEQTFANPQCYSSYCALEDLETTLLNKQPCTANFCNSLVEIKAKGKSTINTKDLNINVEQTCGSNVANCWKGKTDCSNVNPPTPTSASKSNTLIYLLILILLIGLGVSFYLIYTMKKH